MQVHKRIKREREGGGGVCLHLELIPDKIVPFTGVTI